MSQKVNLGRQGFIAPSYRNTIDTSFTQLLPPPPPVEDIFTVEQFFDLYNQLFYEIPAEGSINSQQDIQILLDEITQLREELLSTQKELTDIQSNNILNLDPDVIAEGTDITENPANINTSNPTSTSVVGGNTVSRRY
jgi:hypothetical protein